MNDWLWMCVMIEKGDRERAAATLLLTFDAVRFERSKQPPDE